MFLKCAAFHIIGTSFVQKYTKMEHKVVLSRNLLPAPLGSQAETSLEIVSFRATSPARGRCDLDIRLPLLMYRRRYQLIYHRCHNPAQYR
jgi:hypothetical protein